MPVMLVPGRWIIRAFWVARSADLVSSGFHEGPCFKNKAEEQLSKDNALTHTKDLGGIPSWYYHMQKCFG